jgi:hypothetical protein
MRISSNYRLTHVVSFVMIVMLVSACASSSGAQGPNEFLDEKTAATVSVADKPLVFARERPELAAHARDYVTLAAAYVNRSGVIDYFIFAYFWSTLDPRNGGTGQTPSDELTIAADDRLIHPQLAGHSTQDAGVGTAVRAPPGHGWTLNVYRSDIATLRYMAEARRLTVVAGSGQEPIIFDLWDDQRRSLRALVP